MITRRWAVFKKCIFILEFPQIPSNFRGTAVVKIKRSPRNSRLMSHYRTVGVKAANHVIRYCCKRLQMCSWSSRTFSHDRSRICHYFQAKGNKRSIVAARIWIFNSLKTKLTKKQRTPNFQSIFSQTLRLFFFPFKVSFLFLRAWEFEKLSFSHPRANMILIVKNILFLAISR